jgi:type II secretory pathway pseudopilin PulG
MKEVVLKARAAAGNREGFGLVEVLVAAIILSFGLLAVAGLSVSTAGQERLARWQTDQALAAQFALAEAYQADFDSVASGSSDIEVGEHTYRVKLTVTDISSRVKQVDAAIAGVGPLDSRTFSTRLYAQRPAENLLDLMSDGGLGGGGEGGDGGDPPPPPPDSTPPPPDSTPDCGKRKCK